MSIFIDLTASAKAKAAPPASKVFNIESIISFKQGATGTSTELTIGNHNGGVEYQTVDLAPADVLKRVDDSFKSLSFQFRNAAMRTAIFVPLQDHTTGASEAVFVNTDKISTLIRENGYMFTKAGVAGYTRPRLYRETPQAICDLVQQAVDRRLGFDC